MVLVLGLPGLVFLWAPLPGGIPLFLLSYLLILVLPGFALISYLKPDMSLPTRLIYGFIISLALLVGVSIITVLLGLYGILDYLPSLLLVFSMLLASASYLLRRPAPERDEGQLTLFESAERAQRIQSMVKKEDVSQVEEESEKREPAVSEVYRKIDYRPPKELEEQSQEPEKPPEEKPKGEAPKLIPEDVKPLRDEHIRNGYEEIKPEPEVSHPMWREQPLEGGFRYWDLFTVILLTALTLAFLNLDLFVNPQYTIISTSLSLLFLLGYVLLAVLYPDPKRLGTGYRLMASIVIGVLILAVSFLLWSLDLFSQIPVVFFYVAAVLIVLLVFLAVFRRMSVFKKLEKRVEEPPLEDRDIFIEHDQETIKAREEREAEPVSEVEPVIIPDHVTVPEEEDTTPLEEVSLEDGETSLEEVTLPEKELAFIDEDVEEIIPELAELRRVLEEDEVIPHEEVPLEEPEDEEPPEEVPDVIIPDHARVKKEKEPAIIEEKAATLPTKEAEVKVTTPVTPPLPEEPSPSEPGKPAIVLPWIEREKKPVPHVYEDKPHPITPKRVRSTRPTDLILVVIFTLLTAAFVLIPILNETPIRTVLGILLVLFLPGYSLIAALFPRQGDLDSIERVALSFGLSIAITPLIGLGLNYTPWGIRLDPILICLVGFTLSMCLIAYLRRGHLPDNEMFAVEFGEFFRNLRRSFSLESRTEKILTIILILSILLAIGTTAFVVLKPKQGEKFTEFYLLGPDGKASNYPTNLTVGEQANLTVGVVNHEYATTSYHLVVRVDNITLQEGNITLQNNEKTEIPISFTASTPGQKKMEFLLYKLPDTANPYRNLHIWYTVS